MNKAYAILTAEISRATVGMTYNPNIHHRRSIRLKGYDYSQAGLYFITICIQKKTCLFGNINNDEMNVNVAGEMIGKWYRELENKFSDIKCREMIVMPNHFHCIIENVGANAYPVGADLCVCPFSNSPQNMGLFSRNMGGSSSMGGQSNMGEHIGSPLQRVAQWFKTMTTNEYIRGVKQFNWQRFDKKLWQRNYYEHVIRNEKSYLQIVEYIKTNPAKWLDDTYYE